MFAAGVHNGDVIVAFGPHDRVILILHAGEEVDAPFAAAGGHHGGLPADAVALIEDP